MWRDLHEQIEKDIKVHLKFLLDSHVYDPSNDRDQKLISYLFISVTQRECDVFARIWNSHRLRQQFGLQLPHGIPNHLYSFPKEYGATEKSISLSESDLVEVAELSGLGFPLKYLSQEDHYQLFQVLPTPEHVECKDLVGTFKFLKRSQACL